MLPPVPPAGRSFPARGDPGWDFVGAGGEGNNEQGIGAAGNTPTAGEVEGAGLEGPSQPEPFSDKGKEQREWELECCGSTGIPVSSWRNKVAARINPPVFEACGASWQLKKTPKDEMHR